MDNQKIAQELMRLARELIAKKGEVPEAFKKQWKDKDKDNDGKENEPKPDFLKKKKSSSRELIARRGKMTNEDYDILESFLDKVVRRMGKRKLMEYKAKLAENPKVRDPEMRFRWDLLWASKIKIGDARNPGDVNLYAYMNDAQIDTALKHYVQSKGLDRL